MSIPISYKVTCTLSYAVALNFYFLMYIFLVLPPSLEDANIILASGAALYVSGIPYSYRVLKN